MAALCLLCVSVSVCLCALSLCGGVCVCGVCCAAVLCVCVMWCLCVCVVSTVLLCCVCVCVCVMCMSVCSGIFRQQGSSRPAAPKPELTAVSRSTIACGTPPPRPSAGRATALPNRPSRSRSPPITALSPLFTVLSLSFHRLHHPLTVLSPPFAVVLRQINVQLASDDTVVIAFVTYGDETTSGSSSPFVMYGTDTAKMSKATGVTHHYSLPAGLIASSPAADDDDFAGFHSLSAAAPHVFRCLSLTFHCLFTAFRHGCKPCLQGGSDPSGNSARHRLCLVFPMPSRLRHRLCPVFPLPSRLRHRLCLAFPLPSRLRHRLCLVCSHCLRG